MECPHCSYVDYEGAVGEEKTAEHGEFFYLEKSMRREGYSKGRTLIEKAGLYACPKCRKAFVY